MNIPLLVRSILILLVVWLTITTSSLPETQYIKRNKIGTSPEYKNLNKRDGGADQSTIQIDANTQALWEAYWKTHPENAWDATPSYAGYDSPQGMHK